MAHVVSQPSLGHPMTPIVSQRDPGVLGPPHCPPPKGSSGPWAIPWTLLSPQGTQWSRDHPMAHVVSPTIPGPPRDPDRLPKGLRGPRTTSLSSQGTQPSRAGTTPWTPSSPKGIQGSQDHPIVPPRNPAVPGPPRCPPQGAQWSLGHPMDPVVPSRDPAVPGPTDGPHCPRKGPRGPRTTP